jgi:hypothetical protein
MHTVLPQLVFEALTLCVCALLITAANVCLGNRNAWEMHDLRKPDPDIASTEVAQGTKLLQATRYVLQQHENRSFGVIMANATECRNRIMQR